MPYLEGLSPYLYGERGDIDNAWCVGWLSEKHAFPTRTPTEDLLDKLWSVCSWHIFAARGFHFCEFCASANPRHDAVCTRHETTRWLGSAEICVFARDGKTFIAPNMIYHYVEAHHYAPPDEFLQALDEGPMPPSDEYLRKLLRIDPRGGKSPMYDPATGRSYLVRPYLP